jgi:hypothetical protein
MTRSFGRGFRLLLLYVASGALPVASAEPPRGEVFIPCALRGRALLPMNTLITDALGRPVARFTGAETTVTVAGLSTATPARARVETGTGQGGFRVRGFLDAQKLPIATKADVPVSVGHVWIGARRNVAVVSVAPDKLKLEKKVQTPLQQTFSTWATCGSLTLEPGVPPGWSPAGDARGYVLRASSLELYDLPRGTVVSVLVKAPDVSGVLFHSLEQTGEWVHIEYHGEVVVNGWARASALSALARGETMDQLASSPSTRGAARLALPGSPRLVRAPREIPLRSAAKEGEPIGVIDSGAETYVVDVVAGWASVLPKALDVMPPETGQFWVKKEELGI